MQHQHVMNRAEDVAKTAMTTQFQTEMEWRDQAQKMQGLAMELYATLRCLVNNEHGSEQLIKQAARETLQRAEEQLKLVSTPNRNGARRAYIHS